MEIVLNIPTEKIEGSLEDIMNSLTVEQKQEIAEKAFTKLIDVEIKNQLNKWEGNTIKSVFKNFELTFVNVLKESPAFKSASDIVMEDLIKELPTLAQTAMTAVIANMLAAQFNQIGQNYNNNFDTNMRINNIVSQLNIRG